MPKSKQLTALPPHSWSLSAWPVSIYPNDPKRGRYIVNSNRDELVAAGALARLGREVIVFGAPYCRWLASKADRVLDYSIAPNLPQHAPRRFGGKVKS